MKIKLWISMVLAFLAFIFITQNTEMVFVKFLAWSVEMSLVLLVFIMLGAGVIMGWLLNSYTRFLCKRKQQVAETASAGEEMIEQDQAAPAPQEEVERKGEKEEL